MTKMIVHNLDFEKEGAHVALVTKGANKQEVLLMKKKTDLKKVEEIKIVTSMQTFLSTFFYMWWEDAGELAKILGYEPQEWMFDIIGEDTSVELLKSLDTNSTVSKELYENIEKMSEKFNEKLTKTQKQKEVEMTKKKEDVKDVDLQKKINDAVALALEKQVKETNDLQKSLDEKDAEVKELKKAAEKKEKDEMIELCKGYSFVEDADTLAESLFLCKGIKGFDLILDTLEKARIALKEGLEGEIGTEEEANLNKDNDNSDNVNKTTELIKARNVKENK